MGTPNHEQAESLRSFITANTVVDRIEIAHALVGADLGIEPDESHFPLIWLALAWLGEDLYAHASGDNTLEALCNLACTHLFTGNPCPNCNKMAVFYDGLSERWTYNARASDPWGEYVCPIFSDDDLGGWHRACMKRDDNGG